MLLPRVLQDINGACGSGHLESSYKAKDGLPLAHKKCGRRLLYAKNSRRYEEAVLTHEGLMNLIA